VADGGNERAIEYTSPRGVEPPGRRRGKTAAINGAEIAQALQQ